MRVYIMQMSIVFVFSCQEATSQLFSVYVLIGKFSSRWPGSSSCTVILSF